MPRVIFAREDGAVGWGMDGVSLAATVPRTNTNTAHTVLRTIEAKSRIVAPPNAETTE